MNLLSEKAKTMKPYVAGLQPQDESWIKLNTNENPYPPSDKVKKAIRETDLTKLRLYPDGDSRKLSSTIAENLNVAEDNVFVGNGSDEVLALIFQTFFSGKEVLMPHLSYGFYPVWANMYDVEAKLKPLKKDFSIDIQDYKNSSVILANPNTPTGVALPKEQVEELIKTNELVVIDEAYIDFGGESAADLIKKYDHLLVVRTFSKSYSLAGLRVGFAVGNPLLIKALKTMKDAFHSYPLDNLAQIGATAAIKDVDYFNKTREEIIKTREWTRVALENLGFYVVPSETNFLLVKFPKGKATYDYLLDNKILVRHWDNPELSDFLRITIGTKEEMEVFLSCVKQQ